MNQKEVKAIQKMDLKGLQFQQTFSLVHIEKIMVEMEEKVDAIDRHIDLITLIIVAIIIISIIFAVGVFLKLNGII